MARLKGAEFLEADESVFSRAKCQDDMAALQGATDPTPFILEEGHITYAYLPIPGTANLRSDQDIAE